MAVSACFRSALVKGPSFASSSFTKWVKSAAVVPCRESALAASLDRLRPLTARFEGVAELAERVAPLGDGLGERGVVAGGGGVVVPRGRRLGARAELHEQIGRTSRDRRAAARASARSAPGWASSIAAAAAGRPGDKKQRHDRHDRRGERRRLRRNRARIACAMVKMNRSTIASRPTHVQRTSATPAASATRRRVSGWSGAILPQLRDRRIEQLAVAEAQGEIAARGRTPGLLRSRARGAVGRERRRDQIVHRRQRIPVDQ